METCRGAGISEIAPVNSDALKSCAVKFVKIPIIARRCGHPDLELQERGERERGLSF